MNEIRVLKSNLDLAVIEGSNHGNVASDHIERSQHAPFVISLLTEDKSVICKHLYRSVC